MTARVVVVGAGPRPAGLLGALASTLPRDVEVTVVDRGPQASSPWDAGQAAHVLSNSYARDITLTRPGVGVGTFLEWCRGVCATDLARTGGEPEELVREARGMSELDFASRGLVGSYVAAVIADATARAPFATRCTAGDVVRVRPGSAPRVDLADGRTLSADVVVLATGDDDPGPPVLGASGPRTLDALTPGQPVLVRGIGLTFHDVLAAVTVGRGGRFEHARAGLRYVPSGAEPQVWATSRTGVPLGPKLAPIALTSSTLGWDDGLALLRQCTDVPAAHRAVLDLLARVLSTTGRDLLLAQLKGVGSTAHEARRHLAAQVRSITAPEPERLAAQSCVLATLEAIAGPVLAPPSGYLERAAHATAALESIGARLTSGPPARRTRELAALVDQGVVVLAGAEEGIVPDADGWTLRTRSGERVTGFPAFVDARVHPRRALWATGPGWPRTPGGRLDVDPTTMRLRAAAGEDEHAVFVVGPSGAGAIAALPRPGGPETFFQQNDALACAVADLLSSPVDVPLVPAGSAHDVS